MAKPKISREQRKAIRDARTRCIKGEFGKCFSLNGTA